MAPTVDPPQPTPRKTARLRALLGDERILLAPGCFNALSALLIEQARRSGIDLHPEHAEVGDGLVAKGSAVTGGVI